MPNPYTDHPIALFVRGLPGSGKSYLSQQLYTALGVATTVLLDPDTIDYTSDTYKKHVEQQTIEGVDPALHAYRFLRAQAYQAIQDHQVILWNQPFSNLEIFDKMIGRLNDQADVCNTKLSIAVIEVLINPDTARQRVVERKAQGGHGPSNETFDRFVHDFVSLRERGYDVIEVAGDDQVEQSVATVIEHLDLLE